MTFNIDLAFLSNEDALRIMMRYPRLQLDPTKYCPTCDKTGQYFWENEIHDCDCVHQLALYKHYLAAGIPVQYQRLSWEDFEIDTPSTAVLMDSLSKYMDRHDRYIRRGCGLFFTGPNGVGKTMVAVLVLKHFVKLGYHCFYSLCSQAVTMLTESWNGSDYFQKKFIDSEVLLLDDIGKEHKTALSNTTFDSILRTRVQEGRATFLTTNLTPDVIEKDYGTSVLSLLQENSIHAEFGGSDFRLKSNRRMLDEIAAGETRPIF